MKTLAIPMAMLLALAACDGGTPEAAPENGISRAPPGSGADGSSAQPGVPGTSPAIPPAESRIPEPFQGRWGLAAADCEPGRDDAKGLLTITGDKLEFYESVGTLDEIEASGDTGIRASFDFTGEGMAWEREVALELRDSGQTLIRREYGQDAAPGPFSYSRCD